MSLLSLFGLVTKKQHDEDIKRLETRLDVQHALLLGISYRLDVIEDLLKDDPEEPQEPEEPTDPDPEEPGEPGEPEEPEEPGEPEEPEIPPREPWSLRSDPGFDEASLHSNLRIAHSRAKAYLNHFDQQSDNAGSGGATGVRGYARQGNLYQTARPVRDTGMALLQAQRAVGDKSFLLAADKLLDTDIRFALRRGWRGVESATGQERETDPVAPGGNGYIEPGQHPDGILVWQTSGQPVHTGRDVHLLDDPKTFALIAAMAFAYHENGMTEKRDYWLGHIEKFEEKWRSKRWRRNRPASGPIFNRGDGHVTHAEMVMYVHLHRATGERRWLDYAETIHQRIWGSSGAWFHPVATSSGLAFVWYRGDPTASATNFLAPITYGRYFFSDAIELHRLAFGRYAEEETMKRFARTVAEFVLLPGPPKGRNEITTHRDVGGGTSRAGIPASPESGWRGLTTNIVTSYSSIPLMEVFDDTDRIAQWNDQANQIMGWGNSPRGYALPIARLIAAANEL